MTASKAAWTTLACALAAGLLHPVPASADPGVSLAWTTCRGDGGASNRSFACDTNTGSNQLVISFELPVDLPQVSGNEIVADLISLSTPLPAWWDMRNVGSCRTTSLGFNTVVGAGNVVCQDWAQGGSTGGIGGYATGTPSSVGSIDPSVWPQHRKLTMALAVAPSYLQDLVAGTEYFCCNVTVNNAKTIGTGSCAGCTDPVCLVVNSINVTTPVLANNIYIGYPSSPGSNIVTWQGTGANCNAVPTKNVTWGRVKALYR